MTAARRARWLSLAAAVLVAALWMITRPYRGVRHDGLLYLGQVFHRLMPERFGADPFFAFGSQDQWSIYSSVMAPLIAHFGVGGPELAVLLACHLLFMLGCWLTTREWPSTTLRWLSMLAVAVLPHTYGGLGAFSFGEPFLTARSLAEPFVVLALWQLQCGRLMPAIGLVAIAVAFHPLIALPAIGIGWAYLTMQDRRWAWAGVALAIPAVLGLAGVAPFDLLWRRFDPAWWEAIREPNANAFASEYRLLDIVPVAFDVLVLLLFVRANASERVSRLIRATLLVAVVFTLLWYLSADVMHDVLLTQLQLWRIFWPLHLLALLVVPRVAATYWSLGWGGRWCAAALAAAGLAAWSNWPTGWVLMAWPLLALAAQRAGAAVSPSTAKAAVAASVLAIAVVSWKVAATTMGAIHVLPERFGDAGVVLVVLGLPAVALAMGGAVLWLMAGDRGRQAAGAALTLLLVAYAVHHFDQRSSWQLVLERAPAARPFEDVLPPDARVYWDDELNVPWMLAQRAEFYSTEQGAGLLFNRNAALELRRRDIALQAIQLSRSLCITIHDLTHPDNAPPTECTVTQAMMAEVCHSDPHPDWMVVTSPLPPTVPRRAEWSLALPGSNPDRKSYYLYACSALH